MPSFSNTMRFTGFSGIDTDSMVRQIMQAESMRLHTMQRQRQRLQWQQEDLRGVTSSLRAFQNRFLSAGGSDAIHLGANMAGRTTTVNGAGVTANATANARPGSWQIETHQTAERARLTGEPIDTGITGTSALNLTNIGANDTIRLSVNNGASREVNIGQIAQEAREAGGSNAEQQARFVESLNEALAEEFGTTTVGGETVNRVEASLTGGRLSLDTNGTNTVTITEGNGNGLASLGGFTAGAQNGLDTSQLLSGFFGANFFTGGSATININGTDVRLESTMTVAEMMRAVNENTDAEMSFNGLNGTFTIQSQQTGSQARVELAGDGTTTAFANRIGIAMEEGTPAQAAQPARVQGSAQRTPIQGENAFSVSTLLDGVTLNADGVPIPPNAVSHISFSVRQIGYISTNPNIPHPSTIRNINVTEIAWHAREAFDQSAFTDAFLEANDALDVPLTGTYLDDALEAAMDAAINDAFITALNERLAEEPTVVGTPPTTAGGLGAAGGVTASIGADGQLVFSSADDRILTVGASAASGGRLGLTLPTLVGGTYVFQNNFTGENAPLGVNTPLSEMIPGLFGYTAPNPGASYAGGTPLTSGLLNINGLSIQVSADMTLDQLIGAINTHPANSTPGRGVLAGFDTATGQFTLTSRATGADETITFGTAAGTPGSAFTNRFLEGMGITIPEGGIRGEDASDGVSGGAQARGENALVTITGPDGQVLEVERESNDFNLTSEIGLNFTVNSSAVGEIVTIEIRTNTDRTREVIYNFVEQYNALVEELNELRNTARPRGSNNQVFEPLLDHERAEMSESEIRQWEERSRQGMLHRSQEIEFTLNQMRRAMHEGIEVDGRTMHLFEFGITMETNGNVATLALNESQLDEALATMDENNVLGFFQGLQRNLDEAIRNSETRINRAAGTDQRSSINLRLRDIERRTGGMEDRLRMREQSLFNMFGRLEAAIMQSNAQMDMLWQMGGM